jgi:hypothetical protein
LISMRRIALAVAALAHVAFLHSCNALIAQRPPTAFRPTTATTVLRAEASDVSKQEIKDYRNNLRVEKGGSEKVTVEGRKERLRIHAF